MAGRFTFAMIKPDAFEAGKAGRILAQIEQSGYAVRAMRLVHLTRVEAEAFYEVHRGRPFYQELVNFMSSGRAVSLVLEKAEAADGTIRRLFAESKGRNAVHGSDSDENAAREIAFFFPERELALLGGGLSGLT